MCTPTQHTPIQCVLLHSILLYSVYSYTEYSCTVCTPTQHTPVQCVLLHSILLYSVYSYTAYSCTVCTPTQHTPIRCVTIVTSYLLKTICEDAKMFQVQYSKDTPTVHALQSTGKIQEIQSSVSSRWLHQITFERSCGMLSQRFLCNISSPVTIIRANSISFPLCKQENAAATSRQVESWFVPALAACRWY